MRYYTKEWYNLMQQLHYTSGMVVIPDREYTDAEIQAFYDADLAEEIANNRELHDTPPFFVELDDLLKPDVFQPKLFLFIDEVTGNMYHPATAEEARIRLEKEKCEAEERFANRPPFDPAETIQCFGECYRGVCRYGLKQYPEWVQTCLDPRLAALNRMPESIYKRLKEEEDANQAEFDRINEEAEAVLSKQDIPEEIRSQFCFHDATLLSLRRKGRDAVLTLRKDGGWIEPSTPYIRVLFRNVSFVDREEGFRLRMRKNGEEFDSNYKYLNDELYRTEKGYEVHMLLWSFSGLRQLTIGCEDIQFEDNIVLEY